MLPPNKTSILSAVKPLMNFIRRLPPYAQNSVRLLPPDAIAVRQCILGATEPDSLLFKEIPKALGFSAIADDANNRQLLEFQRKLTAALNDLGSAVQVLIDHCAQIIATEFGVTPQGLSKQVVPRLMALEQVLEKSEFSPLAFQLGGLSVTDHTDTSRRLAMVIADKPPESWTDADLESFPLKARVYIRKLRDFEALHAEMTASEFSEYETNRISIVSAFGEPLNKVVQINKADLLQAEDLAETIIREHLTDNASLTEAVILKLIERIFKRPFEVTREACTQ
jgi:hypothetical protein